MKCIDFDKQFERYTTAWVKANAEKYKNDMDVIEDMMPDVYMEFLSKPTSWLDGRTPEAYFEQFDDAAELVSWMVEYMKQGVPVPDLLMERITELGGEAEAALLQLLDDPSASDEAQMTAISLLRELESKKPMQRYIDFIAALEAPDEKGDLCAEALISMGEGVVEPILGVLGGATEAARDVFADILSNFPGDERIFELMMERFAHVTDRRALFASYLAKLGDDRALGALYAAAEDPEVNYLDYVEIVSAIDALGGDRPPEREFAGDPYYESLKRV
ncbi:MAG: hypothetical protein SPG80_06635 [Candidatus Ventricola sp.]|nr:hypothetical protein [Candidatus Ventricola sp.]